MTKIPCTICMMPTQVSDEEVDSVFCSSCVVKRQNYLDNAVLTPGNAKSMRESRGLSPHRLGREVGLYPSQITRFEAGKRACPAELVEPIYTWFFRGGRG